jgi:HEAT repeat protein
VTVEVPPPIARTFSLLAGSDSPRVLDLLRAGLDVPRPAIQYAAAEAILRQSALAGKLELLARVEDLSDDIRKLMRQSSVRLDGAFRQALLQGDLDTRRIALRAVLATDQFAQLPQLLHLLMRPTLPDLDDIAETLRRLVDRLFDEWQNSREHHAPGASLEPVRTQAVLALDAALAEWSRLARPDDVLEAALILGDPQHSAVKRALWNGPAECRERAARRLHDSRHPGVMRLVAESLSQNYPHPQVFAALRDRDDPEFIAALLRSLERQRSPLRWQHLKQIDRFAWLQPPFEVLGALPPALQPTLVALVNAAALPRNIQRGVQEWLLRHGTPEGRQAATEGLPLVDEQVIQDVVRESLQSDDEEIQAWATTQLREHAIPEAFALLIERLDSPLESVREAARRELSGFNAPRVLALAPDLGPAEAQRAGQLLMKVDRDAATTIRRELAHPLRKKRIRAAHAVHRLGLHEQFASAFVALTDDSDALVRRTGAEVLATMTQPEARRALERLLDDPHSRVRDTARAALGIWDMMQVAEM